MSRDFIIGFLLGVLIVLLLTRPKPPSPPDGRARQGVPREQWGDLSDDEREKLRRAAAQ